MADYESYPTWLIESAGTMNIDPETLPISPDLVWSLMQWAQSYDDTLDSDDPLASGFANAEQEAEFHALGQALAKRLAVELAGQYRVDYFDARTGRLQPLDE